MVSLLLLSAELPYDERSSARGTYSKTYEKLEKLWSCVEPRRARGNDIKRLKAAMTITSAIPSSRAVFFSQSLSLAFILLPPISVRVWILVIWPVVSCIQVGRRAHCFLFIIRFAACFCTVELCCRDLAPHNRLEAIVIARWRMICSADCHAATGSKGHVGFKALQAQAQDGTHHYRAKGDGTNDSNWWATACD